MKFKLTYFTFLLLLIAGSTGCQRSILAQSLARPCDKFTHITISSAVAGYAHPSDACIQPSGTVVWQSGPPDQAWSVQFDAGTGSPLDKDAGLSDPHTTPQSYLVKSNANGSYKYTAYTKLSDGSTVSAGPDYLEINTTIKQRLSANKLPADCDNTSAPKDQTVALSLDNHALKTEFTHLCVMQGSFISWYATPDITAWSITVRDQNLIGAKSSPLIFNPVLAPPVWYGIDCRACKGSSFHKKFSYDVTAIGIDGTVYHLDPDIIVDSGTGLGGEKK